MVDAMCGTGGMTASAASDLLDIQDNILDTDALADHDPVLGNAVETLEESFHERMAHLEYQMENASNPMEKLALEEELMNLEQEFAKFENLVENNLMDIGELPGLAGTMMSTQQDQLLEAVEDAVGDLRSTLMDSYAEFGTAGMAPDVEVVVTAGSEHVGEDAATELGGPCQVPAEGGVEGSAQAQAGQTAGTEASSGTAGADPSSGAEGDTDLPNPEEMVNLLSNDPEAFMDQLSDLDPEDRNSMMMAVQTQMQQINQMFQMASQFSQAMHDTQSAVIQNMRV